jgi:hypothetical protein
LLQIVCVLHFFLPQQLRHQAACSWRPWTGPQRKLLLLLGETDGMRTEIEHRGSWSRVGDAEIGAVALQLAIAQQLLWTDDELFWKKQLL